MIRVNDTVIDFDSPANEFAANKVKEIDKVLDELFRKCGGEVHLSYTDVHSEVVETHTGVNTKTYAELVTIPTDYVKMVNGNAQPWRYYSKPPQIIDGKEVFTERHIPFTTTGYTFDKSNGYDKGLLYYLVFVSPLCEKIPSMEKHQNPEVKLASYKVEMLELEAAEKIELSKRLNIVIGKIYDPTTTLEQLRTWAMSYNMPKVDKMGEARLRLTLEQLVRTNPMNVEKFLQDSNVNPMVQLKADVNKAINNAIVLLDTRLNNKKWRWNGNHADPPVKKLDGPIICDVPSGLAKEQALYEYFSTHPTDYDILKAKNEQQ